MLPVDVKNEARSKLDEYGITDGFWKDAEDIYVYATSAEREASTILINKFVAFRKLGLLEESPSLKPLIKLDPLNTTSVGAGFIEYNLPADYVESYSASYDYTGVTGFYNKEATLITFQEARLRTKISLLAPDPENPTYYIRAKKIGFHPQPIGGAANMYEHHYLHLPAAVSSPGTTAFTLGPETHHAIVNYVIGSALLKDGQTTAAAGFFKQFYEAIFNK